MVNFPELIATDLRGMRNANAVPSRPPYNPFGQVC